MHKISRDAKESSRLSETDVIIFHNPGKRRGESRLIQYKDASGGRKKNATTQWRRRRRVGVSREGDSVGWLGEEQKERSYAIARAFSASRRCTWIVRLWINAIVSSVEWIRSFSSPSPFLFPLPFSLSFENENWLESRFSRWLIKVGKLCGIMYVSLYWIFTPRDENADVRFSANTWHDRKEKRSIVENVAYVTFFNLTWREGCCVWTRLKVIVYEIVQGSPRFLSFRNCELRPDCVKYRACAYREFSDEIYANSETGCLIIWLREGKIGFGSRWPRKSVFLPPWGQSTHPLWFIAFNNNACDNDLMDPE